MTGRVDAVPGDDAVVPRRRAQVALPGWRDATALHRDAVLIRQLLDDLDPDEHRLRSRLLDARVALRAEAAAAWRRRGWRPVTDDR